eukprot:TRINITY_DN35012_c0_g1_i1.p1 TRINITY_DN35012_c0_g1~~TRINITY_DN35012_c0_g1_i1.p1  ORF type:complete len:269 (+),score=35.91 TRINITY_DN35012_c0_g1_i1:112-918(+)
MPEITLSKSEFYDAFNRLFEHYSYVKGVSASQADKDLFGKFEETPSADDNIYLARWYKHIAAVEGLTLKSGSAPAEVSLDTVPFYHALNRILECDEHSKLTTTIASKLTPAPAEPTHPYLAKWVKSASSAKKDTPADDEDDDDDDFDPFDDEEPDPEAERIKEERLAAYKAKKAAKPKVIAKSSVLLDCKPWDDETDMAEMEEKIRAIQMTGLHWGASKLVPVGFGIRKLQIQCTIVDDEVSTDDLIDTICEFEDHVQSVDIAAFNKI